MGSDDAQRRRAEGPASPVRGSPPPWLFGIAALPYGIFNGIIALALPYMLRRNGVPVARIASTLALAQAPAIWYFLWAPFIELRFRRRTWVVILAALSAVCVGAALAVDARLAAMTVLLVVGSVANQPISSALGALAAAVTPEIARGRTAGWGQAGNLGGGALAGGLALWLSSQWTSATTAVVIALLVVVPALAVFTVNEPHRPPGRVADRMKATVTDVSTTLKRRDVWLAFALFLSPAGAGALTVLFPAIAVEYRASMNVVIWVAGVGAGLLMAVGALVGGFVCERFDRWRVYPSVGVLAAIAAGAMSFAPLSASTFIVGVGVYAFVIGLSYAAFMALSLDLLGSRGAAAGTRFTLFIAATNVPLVYMIWLDGAAHARFGVRGMLAMDALANGIAGVLLLGWISRRALARF